MSKISVIVPVYNVASYLDESITSLIAKTWEDWEGLFVNDGSTDASLEILKRYAQQDPRIRVIDQPNAGAGEARNRGLAEAKGKYVYFLDPDDWMEPDLLRDNLRLAVEHGLEMVTFRSRHIFPDGSIAAEREMTGEVFCYLGRDQLAHGLAKLHFEYELLYAVWNKLFLREFLERNAIRFPHYRTGEDFMFNVQCYRKLTRLGFQNTLYYKQRMKRPGSLTTIHFEKIENDRRPFLELWKFFEEINVARSLITKDKVSLRFVWLRNASDYALSTGEGLKAFRVLLKKNGLNASPVTMGAFISSLRGLPLRARLRMLVRHFLGSFPYLLFLSRKVAII